MCSDGFERCLRTFWVAADEAQSSAPARQLFGGLQADTAACACDETDSIAHADDLPYAWLLREALLATHRGPSLFGGRLDEAYQALDICHETACTSRTPTPLLPGNSAR